MQRSEVFEAINAERDRQDTSKPRDERRKVMYAFSAPHVLVLEEQVAKLRAEWYASKSDEIIKRITAIATVAVRALEEIAPVAK